MARRLLAEEGIDAVTHARVAAAGGGGRRSLYRHWPDAAALLHDTLSVPAAPHAPVTGDLATDLRAHLRALGQALRHGLAYTVAALAERAAHDERLERLRQQVTDAGCAVGERLLQEAVKDGRLPRDLDVPAALARLEGPVFYLGLVRGRPVPDRLVRDLVADLLAHPPLRPARRRPAL